MGGEGTAQHQATLGPAQPQPRQGKPAPDARRMKVWLSVSAVLIVAAIVIYLTLGQRGPSRSATIRSPPAGTPLTASLGTLLSQPSSGTGISVTYDGYAGTMNGSLTIPFTLGLNRSGTDAVAILVVNGTSSMQMYRFGGLYYDCASTAGGRSCFNATTAVANVSANSSSIISSSAMAGDLLATLVNSTESAALSTTYRNGLYSVCFYASAGQFNISGCSAAAGMLPLNLTLTSANSTAPVQYRIGQISYGPPIPAIADLANVTAAPSLPYNYKWVAYLDVLALDQPLVFSDLTVIPLTGLFGIGAFSPQPQLAPQCVAISGFFCTNAKYEYGELSFTFGQATGTNWDNVTIAFVPSGSSYSAGDPSFNLTGTMYSGGTVPGVQIQIPPSVAGGAAGTVLQGSIHVSYGIGGHRYGQDVATLIVQAT